MKVVILSGGLGTRLRQESEFRPKPMVEIRGRPILWHIMKIYAAHGFSDFVICLVYKGDMIRDFPERCVVWRAMAHRASCRRACRGADAAA